MTTFFSPYVWTGGALARNVTIEVADGVITAVRPDPDGSALGDSGDAGTPVLLPGLVLPGFANAHSHAFHRALRGRTHAGGGSFWTWRDLMYSVAERLDPDSYYALAKAVYAEMARAGITAVGEFHYLHHGPDGTPYADPNAMGNALIAAAADAGIRITLLDTLYLTATVDGKPLEGVQRRFGDGDLDGWSARVAGLRSSPHARIGAALHSVRAVPAGAMASFAYRTAGQPVHVHLSEQRAENEQTLSAYGCTPTELLQRHGVWRESTVAVHATHLTDRDVEILGNHHVCFCPTTERDLADGIGPARRLSDAGARLSLGSDSHAVIDQLEELRALEMNDRLATEQRGRFTPAQLIAAAANHESIGWTDAGEIAVGMRADFVCVGLDSVRTAGVSPDQAVLAATAADITHVVADGRVIVADSRHTSIDVPRELSETIAALTGNRRASDQLAGTETRNKLASAEPRNKLASAEPRNKLASAEPRNKLASAEVSDK
ncbi:formimidoylglutamate deiminase [Actinoplanes bogorensis]|uniref:Formimidoylglutamate deiminase n=1 Tax=Paractinoplanes bogorensis TaxID=1610840 RepID=A0ABS5Z2V6_9ACTN|nr:formimidoylglutamate deiminase [Actinoplanes bogorensis]MBU2669681.1 formimidoylglutamate deiminase [Actinoplanes bogorensis]